MRARSTNVEEERSRMNPVMAVFENRRRRFSFAEPMIACEVIGCTRDVAQLRSALASSTCPNEFVEIGGATEEEHVLIAGIIEPHDSLDEVHGSFDDEDPTALPV